MLKNCLLTIVFFALVASYSDKPLAANPQFEPDAADGQLIARRRRAKKRTRKKKNVVKKTPPKRSTYWHTNLNIPYRSWLPRHKPSKVLLCIHGLGFNSKSYTKFGRYMAARGIAVFAIDVRGFGEWRKKTGEQAVDFEACINDIEDALRLLRAKIPGARIYLVGESMGGAIALSVTSRYPKLVDALVSVVPSGARYGDMQEKIKVGAHYLQDKDKPMDISSEVIDKATSNQQLQDKLINDPSINMDLTPQELKEFNSFMKSNTDYAALIETTPVIMLAGFKDRLVKPKGTVELFNEISNDDKILVVMGDGEHLLLEESVLTKETAALLHNWIVNH